MTLAANYALEPRIIPLRSWSWHIVARFRLQVLVTSLFRPGIFELANAEAAEADRVFGRERMSLLFIGVLA